ncbi:MAG TPA: Clp protease N-terminal domain-containing protein [Pirellulales bacterium]|jgi:ATP-dependent Clp protease ATP-binding subunit ClpC
MYERFSDSARRAMQRANEKALAVRGQIGTEHVLLAIIEDGNCVATSVLKHLDVDMQVVRGEIERVAKSRPSPPPKGRRREVYSAKRVVEYAMEEARDMGHRYVGTEHILLGLLLDQQGIAAQALMHSAVSADAARQQILQVIGRGGSTVEGMALAPRASGGRPVMAGVFALLTGLAIIWYWLLHN